MGSGIELRSQSLRLIRECTASEGLKYRLRTSKQLGCLNFPPIGSLRNLGYGSTRKCLAIQREVKSALFVLCFWTELNYLWFYIIQRLLASGFAFRGLWSEMRASFMATINSAANEAAAPLACVAFAAGRTSCEPLHSTSLPSIPLLAAM